MFALPVRRRSETERKEVGILSNLAMHKEIIILKKHFFEIEIPKICIY
jgi:hypothetical protein